MEFTRLSYASGERRATITLARPDKRNALDDVMVGELTSAFTAAARDQSVKVVVLDARGPAFCAGADLEYLARTGAYDLEAHRADSRRLAALYRFIYELRKPVIAAVQGPALAGGCGLASVCDFIIASREHAAFGYTEVHIGFIPAIVMVFLVRRLGEGRARELVLGGSVLGAEEARSAGLVSAVVSHDGLAAAVDALGAALCAENSAASMGLCKEMLARLHGMSFVDALDFAANMNAAARMTAECKRGIAAFLAKEKITW
ncbi:MAG TPA: enoyl-CoA hydratase-related protein [Bacteroidota bacterium]|nr:enoyl-CoA hydratase-related protein [Bacteroidota bacterium]